MRHARSVLLFLLVGIICNLARAEYTVQRIITGLDQPTYLTQAPGDNLNLYITQRKDADGSVGNIVKYNRATNTITPFLDISGTVVQDGGVLSMAFHPDFQSNGLFYVTSFIGSTNQVDEFKLDSGTPTLQRTVLAYTNLSTQHTIDWVGFQPGATGAEKNYLYLTTGDGGIQANQPAFLNRGQDPTTVMGKVLRLDVDPLANDAYPLDPNKNFAIPVSNPFVSDDTGKLKEVFETGHRNPWRASFDKETGDLYIGDVGFNTKEEIDFNKNDAGFASGRDFGWAAREGTIVSPGSPFAGPQNDSINPIYEEDHPAFKSITGGYVYRGPIPELQGKYFFGDFNSSVIKMLGFNRDTDPTTFNGVDAGVYDVTDMTSEINDRIAAETNGAGPVTLPVSFGEDNAGNLYIIGLTQSSAATPWWDPPLGNGEIFMITPIPGDTNFDGLVDIADLYQLALHWQQTGDYSLGDFDFDDWVDLTDLSILAQNWGRGMDEQAPELSTWLASFGLPQVAVPEPAALSLIGAIVLVCARAPRLRAVRGS